MLLPMPDTTVQPVPPSKRRVVPAVVIAVVLVALPIRCLLFFNSAMVSRDTVTFIWYAQGLGHDFMGTLRAQDQHPFYPFLIAGIHAISSTMAQAWPEVALDAITAWSLAAASVTVIFGTVAVALVYALTRTLFDARVGLWAGILTALAAEFCQFSADGLSDMPHLALFLGAMLTATRALRRGHAGWALLTGVLSGLAFLTRPEGAEVACVACMLLIFTPRHRPAARRVLTLLMIVIGIVTVAGPYMAATGRIVRKKSVEQLLWGAADDAGTMGARRYSASHSTPMLHEAPSDHAQHATCLSLSSADVPRAVLLIAEKWGRALRITYLLPAMFWLFHPRRPRPEPIAAALVAGIMLVHLLLLFALILNYDYWDLLSMRHVLIPAALTIPFTAAGVVAILDRVSEPRRRIAGAVVGMLLIGPTLPWMLEVRHGEQVYLREAGQWLRDNHTTDRPRVMTTRQRVTFYANGVQVWCPRESDPGRILAEARERRPDYLVFDAGRRTRDQSDFFEVIERMQQPRERLELIHATQLKAGNTKHRALIYRYEAPNRYPIPTTADTE